jgi:hypothetical protein
MTARDELWALALLLSLAAILYLTTWFIDGPPGSREDPAFTPIEIAAHPDPAQS